MKKRKQFIMPSGTIRHVQGYEPFALKDLITNYAENDIKTCRNEIPRIIYEINNKVHYYFPDIYIPSENKIIEVKSLWTYNCKTDNILIKEKACKNLGYNYEIWIYDVKGNRITI